MTMAFETNIKAEPLLSGSALSVARNPVPWVIEVFYHSVEHTYIIYQQSMIVNGFFVSVCFGLPKQTETIRCGSREGRPTPTPTGERPNDDGRRRDGQTTRTTPDERRGEKRQERNANRTADQRNGKHDKQNRNHEETTTDEGNGRSEPTPTDDERESREPTTRRTPPKKLFAFWHLSLFIKFSITKSRGLLGLPTFFFRSRRGRNPTA